MSREAALWQRFRRAIPHVRDRGHAIDLQRIENAVVAGHPDVEGCIDGQQIWAELKSCERPKRATTPVRPRKRESQTEWHQDRAAAGFRHHWFVIQVGEAHNAMIYLIPGQYAAEITAPESMLDILSVLACNDPVQILLRASEGWT